MWVIYFILIPLDHLLPLLDFPRLSKIYVPIMLKKRYVVKLIFIPLEIKPRCSAVGLGFRIIPAGFNAPLEFLTGFSSTL
jgi:hypothetical protein